jgi:hypothetical protein
MTDHPVPGPLPEEEEPFRPDGEAAAAPSAEPTYPWDEPPPPDDPDAPSSEAPAQEGPRPRHDAFTEARKCVYLKALVKVGCIVDACRLVGPSPRTVYRHQASDPRFFDHCRAALWMSGTPVELTAWQRAVEGVEQEFCVAGEVRVRRRYDSNLLRLLLQGSNPRKYGPRPGFKRKRLLRHERKQMEREIRAEIEAQRKLSERPVGEAIKSILTKIEAIERHEEPKKIAAGWTKSPDGHWVPPGYAPIAGWVPPPAAAEAEEPPHDSM